MNRTLAPSPRRSSTLALAAAAAVLLGLVAIAPPLHAASFDPARMPTLRQGSRGWAVLVLQETLNVWRAGAGLGAMAKDGAFGPQTRAAVITFQWRHALYPDGIVGPLTWRALAAATGSGTSGPPPGSLPGWTQGTQSARQAAAWAAAGLAGRFAVVDLASNGGRSVAVYLPQGFDPALPAKLLSYFHGHGGSVGEGFARSGLFGRIRDLAARHPQTIFVFPQAAAAPFGYWMAPSEDFLWLEGQALLVARDLLGGRWPGAIVSRIVAAHSGGGLALKNAVVWNAFQADRIELLDSAYGDWAQVVASWAAAERAGVAYPTGPTIEAWHTPGSTRTNDLDIAARYPSFVTVHASAVGHGDVPTRYLGTALDH